VVVATYANQMELSSIEKQPIRFTVTTVHNCGKEKKNPNALLVIDLLTELLNFLEYITHDEKKVI